jgi:hypothetical protein
MAVEIVTKMPIISSIKENRARETKISYSVQNKTRRFVRRRK